MTKIKELILYTLVVSLCTAIIVIFLPCAFGYDGTANWYAVQLNAMVSSAATAYVLWFATVSLWVICRLHRRKVYADCTPTVECAEEVIISDVESVVVMEEVREQRELEQQENIRLVGLEIRTYVLRTMTPYMCNEHIEILCTNISEWNEKKAAVIMAVVSDGRLSPIDFRHLAWNIGERLKWTGLQRANFIKLCFPHELRDQETETIRRNLRQNATCIIPLDIPEKGDYHFHDTL